MSHLRIALTATLAIACGEPNAAPPTAPTATASLDVPPLPPPKPSAEKPAVRQAPQANDDDSALPRDPAAAEAAFQNARRAMSAGDYPNARVLFLQSYRLDPAIGTLLNLATCEEKLGMRDDALRHYQAAYDGSMREGRKDRAAVAKD